MKKSILSLIALIITSAIYAQVLIDKPIQLSGGNGNRKITNLETPVNGTDAVNKDYVDAAVAGGGGSSMPTMISNEGTALTFGGAVQYCKNLVESSFSDWRLPTFDELTYFVNDPGVSTNYLWSRSAASGKENPVNQNYVTMRLSDGKWRNGGEITGLLLARTVSGSTTSTTFTTVATLSPLTSGNVIIPTHIKFTGNRNSASPCCQACSFRLKTNFADGSFANSSTFTTGSTSATTFADLTSIPLVSSVTPISSIDIQLQSYDVAVTTSATLVVSGYEISMTQADNITLAVRCVR